MLRLINLLTDSIFSTADTSRDQLPEVVTCFDLASVALCLFNEEF